MFASEVLNKNKSIPITLVLTKVDRLGAIDDQLTEELETFKRTLDQKHQKNFKEIKRQKNTQKGAILNKYVKPLIQTYNIFDLYDNLFDFIKATGMDIPNKVFPVTNTNFEFNSTGNLQDDESIYDPYGSAASFLWTIYARLMSQPEANLIGLTEGTNLKQLQGDLLEDIRVLHTSGKAFFDPESQNGIWALRNISNLRADQIEDEG